MTMNIYRIQRTDPWYGDSVTAVVVAENAADARNLAREQHGDAPSESWDTACLELIGTTKCSGSRVVLLSYDEG